MQQNRPRGIRKKISYELCDNLLRFYYAFIYKNKSALTMLGADAFYKEYIESRILTFISYRFEEMCRSYFSMCVKSGKRKGVTNIGTYYYDDSTTHTNGEFDVVLECRGAYDIYEAKYYARPMPAGEMEEEVLQVHRMKGLVPGNISFICISGFEPNKLPYEQISGEILYDLTL